jgi:hypothetical protein
VLRGPRSRSTPSHLEIPCYCPPYSLATVPHVSLHRRPSPRLILLPRGGLTWLGGLKVAQFLSDVPQSPVSQRTLPEPCQAEVVGRPSRVNSSGGFIRTSRCRRCYRLIDSRLPQDSLGSSAC